MQKEADFAAGYTDFEKKWDYLIEKMGAVCFQQGLSDGREN